MYSVNWVFCVFGYLLCLLAFTCTVTASDDIKGEYDYGNVRLLEYKIANTLKCTINAQTEGKDEVKYMVNWLKKDKVIENDNKKYEINNNELIIHRTTEDDLGAYSCVLKSSSEPRQFKARADFVAYGKPTAKIVSQGTFIEGQKITLECVTAGNPPPTIEWRFGNETYKSSHGRVKLFEHPEKKIANAMLQIEAAEMSDRGDYYCRVSNEPSRELKLTIETKAMIRVKDNLAALWPFIGICAEVLVLCAIIFVYERKRNKTELDESDTDISPDQKNTPDHGKDSVRQRK